MKTSTNEALGILRKLISFESISSQERDVALYINDFLSRIGYSPRIVRIAGNLFNVILEIGTGKPSVLIEAHMDVVPAWDMDDAFKPKVENDTIYGRGACDVKGGLTSLLLALKLGVEKNAEPNRKIIVAFTGDEEMYGRGASNILAEGYRADYGLVIEPTNLKLCNIVAGCIEFNLTVYGKSGHGAVPGSGDNAIYKLLTIIEALKKWELLDIKGDREYMRNYMNIGKISGGESAWMTPSEAIISVLIHFMPEYNSEILMEKLKDYLDSICSTRNIKYDFKLLHSCEGYKIPDNDNFVTEMKSILEKYVEGQSLLGYMPSESDANYFYHFGNIKTLVFGPGDLRVAHSSEENIGINDVIVASKVLYDLMFAI